MNDFKYFEEQWNAPLSKEYLVRRGSCCGSGCINCPYTKPTKRGNKKLKNDNQMLGN